MMEEIYPHKWSSVNGEIPREDSLWLAIIRAHDHSKLLAAAKSMVKNGIEWPEVPKFMEYLTGGSNQEQRARDAQMANQKVLDEPLASPEVAEREMNKIRAMLGKPQAFTSNNGLTPPIYKG